MMHVKNYRIKVVGSGAKVTDEQMQKINNFALSPLTPDDVYVRKFLLAHNMIDRDLERFSEDILDDFASTLPGKNLLFGHARPNPGKGLFFDAYTEEMSPEQFTELTGEEPRLPGGIEKVKVLWAWAYLMRIPANDETIANIDGGIYRFVSIGFRAADLKRVEDNMGRLLYYEYMPPGEALEGSLVWLGAQHGAMVQKTAVPFSPTEPADEDYAWDARAARQRLAKWASSDGSGDKDKIDWKKYRKGFAWYDGENPENFGSYKLPHHDIQNGKLVVVWKGVAAAMAALLGARGGVDIPDADFDRVYSHLKRHYQQFGREAPEKTIQDFQAKNQEGGKEKMKEFLAKLSQKLGTVLTEDNALDEIKALIDAKNERISDLEAEIAEKNRKIEELTALAEEGRAYRKSLIEEYVSLRTKLDEIPPDDETRQKQAREIAGTFPVDFLKAEVDILQKRVEERFPDRSQIKGHDPNVNRDKKKDWRKNNPLNPNYGKEE